MNQGQGQATSENGGTADRGTLIQRTLAMPHDRLPIEGTIHQQSAQLAIHLVEAWGAKAREPAGEDKAGRQKYRRLSAQEVVSQACDAAELLFREFSKRDWVLSNKGVNTLTG